VIGADLIRISLRIFTEFFTTRHSMLILKKGNVNCVVLPIILYLVFESSRFFKILELMSASLLTPSQFRITV